MKDVAEAAAVSIQTVSAVVNNKPGISQATSDRVLTVIQNLGYRPFSIAHSLRTRQTHTIALFVSDMAAPPLIEITYNQDVACVSPNIEVYIIQLHHRPRLYQYQASSS